MDGFSSASVIATPLEQATVMISELKMKVVCLETEINALKAQNASYQNELKILGGKLRSQRHKKIDMKEKIDWFELQLRQFTDVNLQGLLDLNERLMNERNQLLKAIDNLKEKLSLSEQGNAGLNLRINTLMEEKNALVQQQATDAYAVDDSKRVITRQVEVMEAQKMEIEKLGIEVVQLKDAMRQSNAERGRILAELDTAIIERDRAVGERNLNAVDERNRAVEEYSELLNDVINDIENQIQREQHQPRNANRALRRNDIIAIQEQLGGQINPQPMADIRYDPEVQPIVALHVQRVSSRVHVPD